MEVLPDDSDHQSFSLNSVVRFVLGLIHNWAKENLIQICAIFAGAGLMATLLLSLFNKSAPQREAGAEPSFAVTTKAQTILVDVDGAVNNPGIYRLAAGSRVVDAINAAGNTKVSADFARINRAAALRDGQKLFVPSVGQALPTAASSTPSGETSDLVNLNDASSTQLETLPGIGPATATAIIEYREKQGPFKSVDQLKNITGIGDTKFSRLKSLVTV